MVLVDDNAKFCCYTVIYSVHDMAQAGVVHGFTEAISCVLHSILHRLSYTSWGCWDRHIFHIVGESKATGTACSLGARLSIVAFSFSKVC